MTSAQKPKKSPAEKNLPSTVYAEIVRSEQQGIAIASRKGSIIYMNPALRRMFGPTISKAKTVSQWAGKLFRHDQNASAFWRWCSQNAKSSSSVEATHEVKARGRSTIWCTFEVLTSDDHIMIRCEDVSEKHRSEMALRSTRFAVEHASDAFILMNNKGELCDANESACKLLGYSRRELLTKHLWDIDSKFPKTLWTKSWGRIKRRGHSSMESTLVRKDGSIVPVEVSADYFQFEGRDYNCAFARDITDKKLSEVELAATHARLKATESQKKTSDALLQESLEMSHSVVDFSPMGMHMYRLDANDDLIFTGANASADRLLGVDNRKFIGKTIEEAFPSLRETEVPEQYRQVIRTGHVWMSEQIEYNDAQISGAFDVHAFKTGPNRMAAMFIDVTERKRAELLIRESEATLRSIFRAAPTGIGLVKNRKLLRVNDRICEMLGYTREELIGRSSMILYPTKEDYEFVGIEKYRQIAEKGIGTVNTRWKRKDGAVIDIILSSSPIDAADPESLVTFTAMDITELNRSHQAMARLTTAVNQAAESIVITNPDGVIVYWNPCFERMTGYSAEEIEGATPAILKSGKHDKDFYADLWKTITSGKTWRGQFINQRKDGSLFKEEAVISPVVDSNDTIVNYVAVKRDVTHEAALEQRVRQSQKMAAIGQFAGRVAHDFTNVLVAILGNAQLAKAQADDRAKQFEYLDEITTAANRIAGFTAELLAFAHPSPPVLKVMKLKSVLMGITEILNRALEKDIEIHTVLDKHPMKVRVDPSQMEQALIHIANNAADAMSHGGTLTIEASLARLTEEEADRLQGDIHERDKHGGDFVRLSLSDTGKGMSPESLSRLFEPFFTTKDTKRHSGLGMTTVYSIVHQHNGTISVYSAPGEGTTITIYLPLIEE